ncbi:MAG: hypothetical protein EOP46_05305 [Sphingobacteriaceae bacterium]|nr:MAG: hypothetical protein EOP46_05305 [Sphingobacteriaceae bacterium]
MPRKLIFHSKAKKEYADAYNWYESTLPGLGMPFETAVDRQIKNISAAPEQFPINQVALTDFKRIEKLRQQLYLYWPNCYPITQILMKNIKQKLIDGYQLGCIKHKGVYNTYLMPVAYWILDCTKFDPNYNPDEWDYIFRNHVYIVTDDRTDEYIKAIEEDIISIAELKKLNFKDGEISFVLYIDIDDKILINWYLYTEIEDYLPNENWVGRYENPIDYLPEELKNELGLS